VEELVVEELVAVMVLMAHLVVITLERVVEAQEELMECRMHAAVAMVVQVLLLHVTLVHRKLTAEQ